MNVLQTSPTVSYSCSTQTMPQPVKHQLQEVNCVPACATFQRPVYDAEHNSHRDNLMSSSPNIVSEHALEQFDEQGFFILSEFFRPGVVNGVRSEMEAWVDCQANAFFNEGINDDLHEDADFETRILHVFARCHDRLPTAIRSELHLPGMFPMFFNSRLLELVEQILGPEIRLYPNYSVRPKFPGLAKTEVLWHQDAAYTASGRHGVDQTSGDLRYEKLRMINVWSPLVPARRENGCMQFVPGSHRTGLVPHVEKNEYYLEIASEHLNECLENAVDVNLDPGDVVLFSNLLFHRGAPNRSGGVRWSCDWRYQDARQSTMRNEKGHMAHSCSNPAAVVQSAEQWACLEFR